MPEVQAALSASAYALFALEQPLALPEIAQGVRAGSFPAAATHTPEWFAAAADGSSLIEMAPELQVLPTDLDAASDVDVSGIDIIHIYAPEMAARTEDAEDAAEADEESSAPAPAAPTPRASTQIGLLKELGDLDA